MRAEPRVFCQDCVHFRSAPYEAKIAGCYLPENMPQKQRAAFLDEQQIPGDHERINARGDCPDHEARARKPTLWQRLVSMGA